MKEIPLTKGYVALVDDEDFEWLNQWEWSAIKSKHSKTVYARRFGVIDGKWHTILMHRLILRLGFFKEDPRLTDHKDRNGLNNQKTNLRVATYSQNQYNKISSSNRKSKYKGVTATKWGTWIAQLSHKGQQFQQHYQEELEAAVAYDVMARKYAGEFALCNFPDVHRNPIGFLDILSKIGKVRKKSPTRKFKGVYTKTDTTWMSIIVVNQKNMYLGTYSSEEEAAIAYDVAARIHHKDKAVLNFPTINRKPNNRVTRSDISRRVSATKATKAKSGYRGIHLRKSGRYAVTIKQEWLGTFDTIEEAARIYNKKAAELYGDNAILNFPKNNS